MLGILAQRSHQEANQSMSSPAAAHNKLTAGQLANLLDSRKEARSDKEVMELAKLYGVDFEVVEALARYVTSPSVESKTVIGPEGEAMLSVGFVCCLLFSHSSGLLFYRCLSLVYSYSAMILSCSSPSY